MRSGFEGGNRLRGWGSARSSDRRPRRRILFGLALVVSLAATACGGDDEPEVVAPDLFDTLAVDDYEPAATLAELAERSDRIASGTIVDVEEGWRYGDAPDDPDATRLIELIVEAGDLDGPIHVVWPYPYGHDIDVIRESMPIGAPVVVYLSEFRRPLDEAGWWHLGPDDGHTHWELTTPQGIIVSDSEAGVAVLGDPTEPFADAPPLDGDFIAWIDLVPSDV